MLEEGESSESARRIFIFDREKQSFYLERFRSRKKGQTLRHIRKCRKVAASSRRKEEREKSLGVDNRNNGKVRRGLDWAGSIGNR